MKRITGIRNQKSFVRWAVMTVLLAMITMMAWAAKPVTNLDACRGEAYSIYVSGWAFDKDAPDYSLSVKVYVYTDAACKNQYAYKKLATGYVDRPDVVTAHSLPSGSKPGFEGRIPITDPGTYYVKVFAIDIDQWGDDVANSSTEMSHSFDPVTVTTLTTIGSAADWNTFVTVIKSGGEDFTGKTVTLTADIPTAEEIAAGTTAVTTITSEEKAFCGTFDGQGHTINVDLNVSGNIAEGLFSNVKGATIKDLTVTGTINNTGMYAGGLVGTAKGATIQNCTFAATINSSGNEIGAFVGGCSQIDADTPGNLTLQDCIFSGSIHITGSYGDSKSAGLVSVWNNTSLTISNCLVKGSFSSERSGAQFYPIAFKTADATVTPKVIGAYYLNTLPATTSGEDVIAGAEGTAVSTTYVEDQWDTPVTAVDGITYFYYLPRTTVTSSTITMTTGIYMVSDDVTIRGRILIKGNVTLYLCEGCTLTASEGIEVRDYNVLTIEGEGTLNAIGSRERYAGIGGASYGDTGESGGTININGGIVTATGGEFAAGIGGGCGYSRENGGAGGTITISGGIVTATGGRYAAGIGGGKDGGAGGTITINGGTVIATGGEGAAGIGGGNHGASGTITISGGTVNATGGEDCTSIGGVRGVCDEITIIGGKVTANAIGMYGTGIGADSPISSGTVTLGWTNEDDYIYATNYKGASIVFRDNFIFTENNVDYYATADNIDGKTLKPVVSNNLKIADITGLKTRYLYTGDEIGIKYEVYDVDGNKLVKGVDYNEAFSPSTIRDVGEYTLTITSVGSNYIGERTVNFSVLKFEMEDVVVIGFKPYYLYTGDEIGITYSVAGFEGNPLVRGADYTEIISPSIVQEKGDYTLTLTAASVGYTGSKTVNFTVGDALTVTSETTVMNAVHRVSNDVDINTRIQIHGDVMLILDEGKTLNAPKGIELSAGNKLTIIGKGTLNAITDLNWASGIGSRDVGTLVIDGGIINAQGGYDAAGIGGSFNNISGGTITINGGTVTAKGGDYAAGIGGGISSDVSHGMCGTITINGGKVTAVGGTGAAGIGTMNGAPVGGSITLGWTNEDDFIYASSYGSVSSISFADGKDFYWRENDVNTFAKIDDIDGKTLIPLNAGNNKNLEYLHISGIKRYYFYTGGEISIDYVVTDVEGNELTEGTHFSASYSTTPIKNEGDYTLTLTAIDGSGYTGSKVIPISVLAGVPVTAGTTEMTALYYKVSDDVTISERITITGDVLLVLDEGKTLTASKGIELSKGNKLTIEGKGRLIAKGGVDSDGWECAGIGARYVGTLVINDGIINATGGSNSAGIGGQKNNRDGGTIIINGGNVIATGGPAGAGIGGSSGGLCGTITINGGKVFAKGGSMASGIGTGYVIEGLSEVSGTVTLGWTNGDDYIYASNYNMVKSVSIADGKVFTDDYGNCYSGTLTEDQIAFIADKTLRASTFVVSPPYTQDFSDGMGGWIAVDGIDHTGLSLGTNKNFMFDKSESNQYLVSPQLDLSTNVKLSFYAKNYVDGTTSYDAKYQVGVSTKSNNISDFVWGKALTVSGGTIQLVNYHLPAEAKYVAIKYLPDPGNYLYIDNISIVAYADVSLSDDDDNTAVIEANNGIASNVTLQGRTFYLDGNWNTLCLPFNVDGFKGTILEDATVKALSSADFNDGALTINFADVTRIEAGKPYIVKWNATNLTITTNAEWDAFAQNVNNGMTYAGKTVELGADISISTMVGTSTHPFCGIFNGNLHKLTLSIDGGTDCAAPFRYIKGATIMNLTVDGSVKGGNYIAGIVGIAQGGTNTISNCGMGAELQSSGTHLGGILGNGTSSNTTIINCYVNCIIRDNSAQYVGLLYGWGGDGGSHIIQNCLVDAYLLIGEKTVVELLQTSGEGTASIVNCYRGEISSGGGKPTQGTDAGNMTASQLANALGDQWGIDKNGILFVKKLNFDLSVSNPVFGGVVINNTLVPIETTFVNFVGCYSPLGSTAGLLLDANNPNSACRAYLSFDTSNLKGFEGWYTDAALTTAVSTIPFDADGTVKLYAKWLPYDIILAENADNGDIISDTNGYLADVTLQGRRFWKGNEWNTLCLPFSMTASQIAGSPLAGAVIKEVNAETSNMTDGTLTLNFKRTTSISAGKPYIVKWANADLVISSEADWEAFATSVAEGVSYYAKTVMLDTDLTVTEMVRGFLTGTFDGNGHTITLDIDYKESTSNPGQALFYQLSNATVKNLQVEGWVTTSGHRPANIAVYADGTSTISNCTCGASIESTLKNSWVDGGAVVACIKSGATLNITDCYARASVYYEKSAYSGGGVVGWTEDATATANLERCVYAPTWIEIEKTDNDPHYFVSGPGQKTLSKCFYNETAEESVLTAEGTNWGVYYNTNDLWSYLGWKRGIKLPKEVVVEFASIEDPVFKDVIIESGNTSVVNFDGGQFVGSYSPFADISGLLLDDHNPDNGACRAALSLSRAFEGWYTDDALTTPVTTIPFTSNGTVKLYAKWSILAGDVNGDGLVTITDAAVLMDYIKTGLEPAGFVMAAAEVDGKPGITMSDAVAILEMILNGLP